MKRKIIAIIISSIFLLGIVFRDELYYKFWLLADLILLVIILGLLLVIFLNLKKDRTSLIISLTSLFIGILIVVITDFELLKSRIIFEAVLVDDLSSLTLRLRENHDFELLAETYLGATKPTIGKYKMQGNKIIFLDRPSSNDFIGDTVYIIDKKLILKFDSKGMPDTSFANYFRIDKNEIKSYMH